PVPKVIDFGVAKATQQQPLTDLTIYTQFEQMIGTPLYMSPEQAEMSGLDIDTRSDIYSLGVLLYELLTGRTPFDPAELMRKGYDEIRRAIREQEPRTPSTFLQTMADATRTTVAQQRQSDPAKLMKQVRGDLDWIVMKALEKDRTRRYETANGLAMDIQRHLANEPVNARPASQLYRLRRLVRRNRGIFAAAGAVTAALMIGLGMATRSYLNERQARAGETKQREIAEQRSRQAQTSAVAAQASARKAAASEVNAKRFLYAADMNLVQQALRSNNIGRARLLLDRHRPVGGDPDLRGWEWRYLWQQCRSGAQALLTERDGVRVFSVSFSPDGAWLAVGYFDGQVELWDVAKRQLARRVQEPFDQRAHVAFSPRGDVLVATMGRSLVKTHSLVTGADILLCTVANYVRDLSFSPDGELLAVLSAGPDSVQVLRVADGALVMTYPLPSGGGMHFNNARLSPDKQRLYVSCGAFEGPKVRCVSVPEAQLIWEVPIGRIEDSEIDSGTDIGFTAMDLSPDGRTLVVGTGYSDHSIRVLDASTGEMMKKLAGHTGWPCELTFSKDGRVLASASEDQTIGLWNASTWKKLAEPLRGHTHEVQAVSFTRDARLLASGSKDGQVLLWSTHAPRPANGIRNLPRKIERALGLSVNRMVVGRTRDHQWSLIDLLTLSEEPLPEGEAPPKGELPAILPETRRRPKMPMDGRALGLTGMLRSTVSPDRKVLAVASEDGMVGLYDAETKAKIDVIRGNMGAVFGLAFSPDNQRLVLAGGGIGKIEVWDATTRQVLLTLSVSGTLTTAVEFTDNGNTLLIGSEKPGSEGFCQFWSAPS
ncbi:MAG: WD40 repeat domain-containing serine/threonine-protein kinase, partial [Verrucomicrobiota bacterium]